MHLLLIALPFGVPLTFGRGLGFVWRLCVCGVQGAGAALFSFANSLCIFTSASFRHAIVKFSRFVIDHLVSEGFLCSTFYLSVSESSRKLSAHATLSSLHFFFDVVYGSFCSFFGEQILSGLSGYFWFLCWGASLHC